MRTLLGGVARPGVRACEDGRSATITAPSGPAQQRALQASLRDSELRALEVSLIECHGTGTSLGDPIEVGAQEKIYAKDRHTARPVAGVLALRRARKIGCTRAVILGQCRVRGLRRCDSLGLRRRMLGIASLLDQHERRSRAPFAIVFAIRLISADPGLACGLVPCAPSF